MKEAGRRWINCCFSWPPKIAEEWILRAKTDSGRALAKSDRHASDGPTRRLSGFRRRSGCVPAEPYPLLKPRLIDFLLRHALLDARPVGRLDDQGAVAQPVAIDGFDVTNIANLSAQPRALAFSPDGRRLAADVKGDGVVRVESPMVGVFYRAPQPGSPPFVEVGDVVAQVHELAPLALGRQVVAVQELGARTLRGIAEPVRLFRVAPASVPSSGIPRAACRPCAARPRLP